MLPSGNDAGVVFAEHFGGKQRDLRYLDAGEVQLPGVFDQHQ